MGERSRAHSSHEDLPRTAEVIEPETIAHWWRRRCGRWEVCNDADLCVECTYMTGTRRPAESTSSRAGENAGGETMLNRAELIGRLTHPPELRYTSEGTPVCRLAVATNLMVGTGDNREERTEYHDITAWGTLAETCAQYLAKGRLVYVDGHLHTEKWERDDVPQRRTVIVASVVRFLDRPDVAAPAVAAAVVGEDGI